MRWVLAMVLLLASSAHAETTTYPFRGIKFSYQRPVLHRLDQLTKPLAAIRGEIEACGPIVVGARSPAARRFGFNFNVKMTIEPDGSISKVEFATVASPNKAADLSDDLRACFARHLEAIKVSPRAKASLISVVMVFGDGKRL